jgi:hypothetical protein
MLEMVCGRFTTPCAESKFGAVSRKLALSEDSETIEVERGSAVVLPRFSQGALETLHKLNFTSRNK